MPVTRQPRVDLGAVLRRYRAALAASDEGAFVAAVVAAAAQVPALLVELGQARAQLGAVRLRYANLVAAGRATLIAHANGERDPLAYLCAELPAPPVGHPLHQAGWRWGGGR